MQKTKREFMLQVQTIFMNLSHGLFRIFALLPQWSQMLPAGCVPHAAVVSCAHSIMLECVLPCCHMAAGCMQKFLGNVSV
jgi:hypothetical protein